MDQAAFDYENCNNHYSPITILNQLVNPHFFQLFGHLTKNSWRSSFAMKIILLKYWNTCLNRWHLQVLVWVSWTWVRMVCEHVCSLSFIQFPAQMPIKYAKNTRFLFEFCLHLKGYLTYNNAALTNGCFMSRARGFQQFILHAKILNLKLGCLN